jgi:hypothetical protein
MADIIAKGTLNHLSREHGNFHELSMSRLGFFGDESLARMLLEELKKRGLAKDSVDGHSIPMHREVRILILVLLAQILRARGAVMGMELLPATDRSELVRGLIDLLSAPPMPSAGAVVASDLQDVGVNLASVPLDELLDYRMQHLAEHQRYAREVRSFVRVLSALEREDRDAAMRDRSEALREHAASLRAKARAAWGNPSSLALAGMGAIWTAATGDPIGALFGGLSAAAAAKAAGAASSLQSDAFSYLISLPRHMYA